MSARLRAIMCAALLVATSTAGASQAPSVSLLRGTWAATTSTKPPLQGTWSAQLRSESPNAAAGTWTLLGATGRTIAQGTWSAIRTAGTWSGTWSARAAAGRTVRSGTWSTQVEHGPPTFADLLRSTLEKQLTGTWHSVGSQGQWALRATSTQ